MSRIDDLIRQHCPDGVKHALLVNAVDVIYGCPFESNLFTDCPDYMPLIRIRDLKEGLTGTYYSGDFDDKYIVKRGHVVIGMDGEFNVVRWKDRDGLLNQRVCRIESKDETSFLTHFAYYILGDVLKRIEEGTQASTVKHLSAKVINKIEIPVPPIEVQEEIVRILDAMCELEAKLQVELEARETQFDVTRKRLIEQSDSNALSIGKFCEISRGKVISKQYLANHSGEYPVYSSQTANNGVFGLIDSYAFSGEYVTWTTDGANAGTVFYRNGKFSITNVCGLLKPKEDIATAKYLSHALSLVAKGYVSEGMGNPKLMSNTMSKIEVLLPPIKTQREIVAKLDAFEALIQSLRDEIELRHRQFEHYRDKLLSFEKKGA